MKNKIEIQIQTPSSKEQLIALRDEIRKIEGLEAFDLKLPPAPLTPGKMTGGVEMVILEAVISGVTHFTAEKTFEHYEEEIVSILKKIFGRKKETPTPIEAMSGANPAETEKWQVTISDNRNGVQSVTAYSETGAVNIYNNREYSIDPEHTHAILIGAGEYDDRANFSPIPPVAGNIDEMYRVLTDKRFVGLPYENITRLYNESCINIKDELRNVSRIKDIKTLIVYYSGHGQNTGNNQLSLIAKDTRTIDDELHNDIPYAFVEKMMNSSQADQKIVFIDACHSGLAAQGNSNVFDFEPVLGTFTLASTSAEESSYFKRDASNTYFTTYLTDAFKEGITNSNTMLSLADLYNYTTLKLSKMRLPAPVCKSQLKNIMADRFYISGNPSFSLEARLGMPKQLYQQGRIEEARREYIRLEKEYPDNQQLRNEHIEFERNAEFNRLVKEGDGLFFRDKNFKAAQNKYREALTIKQDESVRDKIADCENNLLQQSTIKRREEIPVVKKDVPKEKQKQENRFAFPQKPISQLKKKKISWPAKIIIGIIISTLFYFLFKSKKEYEFTDADGTKYSYVGAVKNGKPEGEGKAKYNNGNEYEGQWVNGVREGKGTFTWSGGDTYTGYFKNNYLHGTGVCKYKNGDVYDGYWSYGVAQGQGTCKYKNGNVYEGSWYNNRQNGRGVFTWVNGDKYDGQFKNDFRDGYGTYTCQSTELFNCPGGKKYTGYWKEGAKEGFGRCFDAGGRLLYEGNFRNDAPVLNYPNR